MRRFFVKNILFTGLVNMLVMPVWVIFIDRTVQNRVGAAAYGAYVSLFNLSLVFQILLDFGINNYNTRTVAQNPGELKNLFPSMFSARLLLIILYASLILLIGFSAGYSLWELSLLSGIILIQSLLSMVQFIRSNVAALHHFKTDSLLSVSGRLLMILICGFLLVNPSTAHAFKIEWFVITQVICYFIAAVIALIVLNKIHPIPFRLSFRGVVVMKIIKDSLPYALLIFLMSIYTRSDMWLLKQMLGEAGKEQAGIYAAAYRWLDVGNNFGLMFAGILLPMFGRMIAQKNDVNPIVKLSMNLMLPLALIVATASVFFGAPLVHLLYTAATDYYAVVFAWVMCTFPAFCIMYVYSTLLTANGSLKALNSLALCGVIINLSLNFYMIPRYGALGSAVSAFVTQSVLAVGFIFYCNKILKIVIGIRWVSAYAGFLVLVLTTAYFAVRLPVSWILQLSLFSGIAICLFFVFRFVSIKSVSQLASNK